MRRRPDLYIPFQEPLPKGAGPLQAIWWALDSLLQAIGWLLALVVGAGLLFGVLAFPPVTVCVAAILVDDRKLHPAVAVVGCGLIWVVLGLALEWRYE